MVKSLGKKDSLPEPKAKVKKSDLGTKGNNARAPKGSKESLKGGNKNPKQKVNSAGH